VTIRVCYPGGDVPALDDVVPADSDADVLVAGVPAGEDLERHPRLRAVVIPYAGVPRRTRELLRDFPHIALYNLHHNAAATAETAMALYLAALKRIVPIDRALRRHDWTPRYGNDRPGGCDGATAVVLGFGAIGRRIGRACEGLGMAVLGLRRQGPTPLAEALPRANVLFVCVPWTERTEGLIGAAELARLPDGAVVVNVARGPVVDETALYRELATGRLAAGLDVWWRYPKTEEERAHTPPSAHPFHELDNVVMSPHRGGHVAATEALRARHLADVLAALARGESPPTRVDLDRGY